MTKHLKKVLALMLAIVLCLSGIPLTIPFPAFAVGVTPDNDFSSEVTVEPEELDITPYPEPESSSSPRGSPASVEPAPDNDPSPSAESDDDSEELSPGTELDIYQVWPAMRRAQARAAAGVGTSGTLYVGDYCFPSGIGVPPTLGEWIGPTPVETMKFGSNNVAAYCLEHAKESGDGMGYTWMDLTTNNQETVGTILALGFQWNSPTVWAVPSDNSDKWVVTQLLIWETIAGHAFVQGNGLIGVESGVDADMQMVAEHAYNPTKFMEYYRDLKKRLNDYFRVIELGTIDDHEGNGLKIGTTATVNGEKIAEPVSEITLVDVVAYSNLEVGKTYKLSGVLMDKETGTPLEIDGQQVTVEKEFTPEKSSGTEEMAFTFNASALAGKAVVVFEDLYEGDKKVASHADIEDEGQTVTFTEVKIGTTATANGEHTAEPVGEITLIDTVSYSGLIVGKEYTVKGVLMDKATNEPLLVNDDEVTAEASFIGNKYEGTIDIPFTFDASALSGKTIVAFETLYHEGLEVAVHADIEDEDQTVTFSDKPEIKTTATAKGEKITEPVAEITIVDVVSYTGLTVGKIYTLKGMLMDKATNQPLLVDGEKVTAEAEFTAETENGTVDVEFSFDASVLAGKSVVVFEHLYNEDVEVAAHADITDEGQTVEFKKPDEPEIKTTATVDGNKLVAPQEEIILIDTVTYYNLVPGKTYTVKGVLMDKSTWEKLLVDGKEITAEKEFTPDKANGTVEIPFTFKGVDLAEKSIVVFESLYQEGIEVAVHADIDDTDQTVEIVKPDEPGIRTKAAVNGEQKAHAVGEVTIIDTVSYANLTPGKTYIMEGVLMDKGTGEPLLVDGQIITAEKEFTPDKAVGTVEMAFTFDAFAVKGKDVVVFEELFLDDKKVANHTDIEDKDQTIVFDIPEIKTKATVIGEKKVDPLEEITVIDTVTYINLTPGKTYTVKGVLMDKSTGKKLLVDGKEITAETEFTPNKADGSVELPFTFNASGLAGKSIVAFETLYHEDKEVAVHTDIEDEDQTVTIKDGPQLKTTATIGGKKETTVSKEIVLDDVVAYTGLTPGKEYTVKGVLMDKSTGKKLLIDGKEVAAEITFTPDEPDGEVIVTFKFDASGFKERTDLVVFKTLYQGDKEIVTHADITDTDQTVTLVPEKPKTPDIPKTGDDRSITGPLVMMGLFFAALIAAIFLWYRYNTMVSQIEMKKRKHRQ